MRLMAFFIVALVPAFTLAEPVELQKSESEPRPTPDWVRMVDLGEKDPALKGYRAPAGVKVEVVAQEPLLLNPVAMRFQDDGSLLVIEWRVGKSVDMHDTTLTFKDGSTRPYHDWRKDVKDVLKRLIDTDGDGVFDKAEIVMDDLELPSSVLVYDGWYYFTTRGGVTRRRQSKPGGPFDINERVVQGLAGFNQHQASGLTMSPDGWLYITSGDDDSHAEGSDGTRIDLLRTGAVWRCRPDGSKLQLFARGFRNPYGNVAFDAFGNIFHTDNDQEDGSKFQGCRLIHVMEEADYGWRLRPGVRCCWPDADRGAVFGEKPGKLPPMLKTGRGAPCGVMVYNGAGFPDFFRGLIVYPDVFQKNVRCYKPERDGSTFKITEQFTLLESTQDGLFRPCQAAQGPDGSIYLCDWRTNSAGPAAAWGDGKHGRIWRLSWEGTPDTPAIPRGKMDAWAEAAKPDKESAMAAMKSLDIHRRARAAHVLLAAYGLADSRLLSVAADVQQPTHVRISAFLEIVVANTEESKRLALQLAKDPSADLRRLAYESMGMTLSGLTAETLVGDWILDKDLAARRAAVLAIGRIAGGDVPRNFEVRRKIVHTLEETRQSDRNGDLPYQDGILRALERADAVGGIFCDSIFTTRVEERHRSDAIADLTALRTREGATALKCAIEMKQPPLTGAQRIRIFQAYGSILLEKPVSPTPLIQWLEENPESTPEEQAAALRAIALLGQMDTEKLAPLVLRLLGHPKAQTRFAAIDVIREQRLLSAAKPLVGALRAKDRSADEKQAILGALATLRGQRRFAQIGFDPGVDALVDDLAAFSADPASGSVRGQTLNLVAQIDFKKAEPVAMKMLDGPPADAAVAISVLGANPASAKSLGQRFIDGKLPKELLPQVAAALQRHLPNEGTNDFTSLRQEVLKRGLSVATDPAGVKRLEELVSTKGNPARGKVLFLDQARTACVTCHKLEGIGAPISIGPDLTGLHQNSTVAKLAESILEPSKEIKEGFELYNVETKSGQTYAGFKVSADANQVVLRDTLGQQIVVPTRDVKKQEKSKLSLMPEGLTAGLSLDEFVDLLAFLKDPKTQAQLRK